MEMNKKLMSDVEEVFALSEARVVIAFEVLKQTQGFRYWHKAGNKKEQSPRVLCLTVKRSKSSRGFKGTLHVCKPCVGQVPAYVIRTSWNLKGLVSIEAPVVEGKHDAFPVELSFENDKPRTYVFSSSDDRMCFIAIIREVCRIHEEFSLAILGMVPNIVADWWDKHWSVVLNNLGEFAAELLDAGLEARLGDLSPGSSPTALVSPKEERDLGALLELFAMGLGDVEDFQQKLQEEHAALEDANVHAILEGAPAVERIMGRLKNATNLLDDLDQNLQVFDLKLRHMREDITAIEARNNMLEMEARNNGKLLGTLRGLLDRLQIKPDEEQALHTGGFDEPSLLHMLQSAWSLYSTLEQLDPETATGLSEGLHNMRAVKDQKIRLQQLGENFVSRAADYLDRSFRQLTNKALQELAGSPRFPSADKTNTEMRVWCNTYAPLLQVMHAINPTSLRSMQLTYCQIMNSIIRRRVHGLSRDLRAAVKLTMSHSPGDGDIAKKPVGDTPKSAFDFVMGQRSKNDGSQVGSEDSVEFDRAAALSNHSMRETGSPVGSSRLGIMGDVEIGTELHAAYQTLLQTVLPMLVDEAQFAAHFLLLYKGHVPKRPKDFSTLDTEFIEKQTWGGNKELTAEGTEAIESLLMGVESEFFGLVEMTGKSAQLMCLPMLATTLQAIDVIASEAVGWQLLKHLQDIQQKLRTNFNLFMQQRVAAIDKYESRNRTAVKHLHVLPFVANFAVLAHRIELLLTEVQDGGFDQQESDLATPNLSDAEADSEQEHQTVQASPLASNSQRSLSVFTLSGAVRQEVDLAYMRIVGSMFRAVENMANLDPKHGDRLKLENYAYFEESVHPLVRHVKALENFCNQAVTLMNASMQRYVQQQLEYGRLWKIFEFSMKLEELLKDVGPTEVPFQAGCSAQDLRSLLNSTMTSTDKKLASMYARVKKHLGEAAPKLLYLVWSKVEDQVLRRYVQLEEQMQVCYPSIALTPSPEELKELFKTTGPGS